MVNAVPNVPGKDTELIQSNIRVATSNLFVLNEPVLPVEEMTQLIFQDIGGTELPVLMRHNSITTGSVDQQNFDASTFLSDIYSPTDLISMQGTDKEFLNTFSIDISKYIPSVGNGTSGEIVYINKDTTSTTYNNIIIDLVNIENYHVVEVQFVTFDSLNSDTIYP